MTGHAQTKGPATPRICDIRPISSTECEVGFELEPSCRVERDHVVPIKGADSASYQPAPLTLVEPIHIPKPKHHVGVRAHMMSDAVGIHLGDPTAPFLDPAPVVDT
jgi:hypothetical protein